MFEGWKSSSKFDEKERERETGYDGAEMIIDRSGIDSRRENIPTYI
jgi:hypothetical protein